MSEFNAKHTAFEIKQLFARLMVEEIIDMMDRSGLPKSAKKGCFRDDYLPSRLATANAHQLASLKAILKTRLGNQEAQGLPQLNGLQSHIKFNVFISHGVEDGEFAADLKQNLEFGGINCFAGFADGELDAKMLEAIITGLDNADVLVSLNSEDSSGSAICNQEIGFALGKELPVISLNLGASLQGLLSPLPSLDSCSFDTDKNIALKIIDQMLQYPQIGPKLTDVLVERLVTCASPVDSFRIIGFCRKALAFSKDMTASQLYELRKAARENDQIARFASGRGPELIESMCCSFEERLALTG